jgi:hypothetical protein
MLRNLLCAVSLILLVALATGNTDAAAAMDWVISHMEDADFNDPLPPPAAPAGGTQQQQQQQQQQDPEKVRGPVNVQGFLLHLVACRMHIWVWLSLIYLACYACACNTFFASPKI